jgi:hypothetical protein
MTYKTFLAWIKSILKEDTMNQNTPVEAPKQPLNSPVSVSTPNPDTMLPWNHNAADNRHNVRVCCDLAGMAVEDKNILCAVVGGESGWLNYLENGSSYPVTHRNLNKDGSLSSTDWGLCQVNDFWHIGEGKDFPSVDYVMQNPTAVVQWMIEMYKAGKITMWDAYLSGAYLRYL